MGRHCVYGTCNSDSRFADRPLMKGVIFIPFPKPHINLEKCKRWINACAVVGFTTKKVKKDTYVCSKHFVGGKGPTEAHPDIIPAYYRSKQIDRFSQRRKPPLHRPQSLPHLSQSTQHTPKDEGIDETVVEALKESTDGKEVAKSVCEKEVQTVYKDLELQQMEIMELKNKIILLENKLFCTENKNESDECTSLATDNTTGPKLMCFDNLTDYECNLYTGLSLAQFNTLVQFLGNDIYKLSYWPEENYNVNELNKGLRRKLSAINELFLTLVRLKTGRGHVYLANEFGISTALCSKIIITWVQFLYIKFKSIQPAMFATRHIISKCIPSCFKKYKNLRCIIDCTEVFCQRASNFAQQGNSYSAYKGNSTFKVLVACTPNGAVMFVSDVFEGSISDREIVDKSGFLNFLEPGDVVMADRGFLIEDLLMKYHASLVRPPFLGRNRTKLTHQEEVKTKQNAKLRIHVERVIGVTKTYKIMQHKVPLSIKYVYSQMVFVIGCLVNLKEPLVK